MAVHLEFIADDLGTVAGLLAPLSSNDVALEFTQQGDVYISIDLREPTPESDGSEPTPAEYVGGVLGVDLPEPDEPEGDTTKATFTEQDEPITVPPVGDLTCPEAIVALLEANPDRHFPALKVVDCLPQFKEGTIKMVLAKLARQRKVSKVRPGVFEAL